jgi:hypothetical protein
MKYSRRSRRPGRLTKRETVTDIWFSYLRALDKLAVPLILKDFPELTRKQVLEALRYARENMDELQQEIKEDREAYEKGDPIPPKPIQST